jgi:hypothetical protein
MMIPGNMVKVHSLTNKLRQGGSTPNLFTYGLIIKGDGSPEYGHYRQVLLSSGEKVMVSAHRLELI